MPKRVSEPVQVYLDSADRDRLDRLVELLGTSKSDTLRRSIRALEREVSDPEHHPALRLIGMAEGGATGQDEVDPARGHDQVLADSEVADWSGPSAPSPGPSA